MFQSKILEAVFLCSKAAMRLAVASVIKQSCERMLA